MPKLQSAVLLLLFIISCPVQALPINDLVVFGDSLSDSGNLFIATGQPGAPYFNGRVSNGLNYADRLQQLLSPNPLLPSMAGGTNYAWAKARAGFDLPVSPTAFIPGINSQVGMHLATNNFIVDSNDLFLINIGGNDVADAIDQNLTTATAQTVISNAITEIISSINLLAIHGAKNFLLPSLPDLSLTPLYFGQAIAKNYTDMFNQLLKTSLNSLNHVNIIEYDTNKFIQEISHEFTHTSIPCLTPTGICKNPENYMFFDSFHPTAKLHSMISDNILRTIPTPPSILIMLIWLILLRKSISQFK